MDKIKSLLRRAHSHEDHPVYHPEKYLINHIMLVTLRSLYFTGDANLIMASIIHDLFKPDGKEIILPEGKYISNPDHPKQAYEFIHSNDDVKYWIKNYNADYNIVAEICKWHMACKDNIIKKAKHIPFIDKFVKMDDMCNRHYIDPVIKDIYLPNDDAIFVKKQIDFIGVAQIHQMVKKQIVTVTVERTPCLYEFYQLPEFFINEWSELKTLFYV